MTLVTDAIEPATEVTEEVTTEVPAQRSLLDILIQPGGYEAVMAKLAPSPHPVMPIPTLEQCVSGVQANGEEWLPNLIARREQAIRDEQANPIYYGYEPQQWRDADALLFDDDSRRDILISGSNRGSKSEYCAKRVVQLAIKKRGAKIWCFSTSSESSVRDQQSLVYKYLPAHLKPQEGSSKKRTAISYLTYSQANGFNNRVVVLPNGSEIRFMNYEQERKVIEGGQIDLWWGDEGIPRDWIITLRGRTVDRRGKGIVSYTPIDGFTPSIDEYFTGATVTDWRPCEIVPHFKWPGGKRGFVPYKMECLNSQYAVIFFSAKDNPYIVWEDLVRVWKDKPTEDILIRLYGVTQKRSGNVFPRFGKHNIVNHDAVLEELKKPTTRYHVIDFAWSRNWFMLWAGVQRIKDKRRIYIYREWPDFNTYGEWVIADGKKPDGLRGPAQSPLGWGVVDYKRCIHDLEHPLTATESSGHETIYARFGDPRSGAATSLAEEGTTTIFNMLQSSDKGVGPLDVQPVAGTDNDYHIREGVNLINEWLEYNPDKPISVMNEPSLFISENCGNLIRCMQMWTGQDGDKGASKDPIDCFDSETEILTEDGWVPFPELEKGRSVATLSNDGFLEFQVPTEYIDRAYSGEMISAIGQATDFMVTPNHRMLVYAQSDKLSFRLAKDLKRQDTIPINSMGIAPAPVGDVELWPGKKVNAADWAEFIGWYVSEGAVTGTMGGAIQMPGRGYSIYISQSMDANPDKCERISRLLDRLAFRWAYRGNSFTISSKRLWYILRPLGNKYEKHIPRDVMALPRECLERLWAAMVDGDGWKQGGKSFYASVSRRLIDDVSELLSRIGRSYSNVHTRPAGQYNVCGRVHDCQELYQIGERKGQVCCITTKDKKMLVKSVQYSGRVYCVAVPNGTLLVRRNGKQMFCGNCLRYLVMVDPDVMTAGGPVLYGGGSY